MNRLYDSALVHLPDGRKVNITKLVDIVTMKDLTPTRLDWIMTMVTEQLREDGALHALSIKPGYSDYILRQIIYYGIDAMLGDQ